MKAASHLMACMALASLALLPACSKAQQAAEDTKDSAVQTAQSAAEQASDFLSAAAEKAKQAASRAADATMDAASRAAEATKDAAAKTGRAVGEHAGQFFSGVGEGIERAVVAYDVDLSDPSLAPVGASVNIVRHVDEFDKEARETRHFILVYFLNQSPVDGTLRLVLRAADAREIGRSELPVALPADSATYLRFPLSRDLPTDLVRTVSLSLHPAPTPLPLP
jgi:hypothetical protein